MTNKPHKSERYPYNCPDKDAYGYHSVKRHKMGKAESTEPIKYDGKVQDNYDKYLQEVICIGITEIYPVKKVLDTIRITRKCRNFDVIFDVQYVMVEFSKSLDIHAVVTERVDIAGRLPGSGWGSHCYADEAKTMEEGVIEMCKKHNLMICTKVCSWPFAKAIVQANFYKD